MEIVYEFLKLIAALLVLGLSTERGVELLKVFWNFVTQKYAWLSLRNKGTFVFAAAAAFAVSYYFKVDITHYLSVLDGFDPQFLQLINALLLTLAANTAHDKLLAGGK